MENFSKQDTTDFEENFKKGFSREQILQMSLTDIEDLYLAESYENVHPANTQEEK